MPSRPTRDIVDQAVLLRAVGQQHLEEFRIADRHDHVQVGDVVERVAAVMNFVVHAERFGQMSGLHQRGDAAFHRHVAAQIVRRLQHDPRRIAVVPGDRILGRHHRNVQLLLELDVVVDVLIGQRIFVPVKTHLLDCAADSHRRRKIVAPGRIEHDRVVVANRPSHRFAHLDVLAPACRRMDLVGGPAVALERQRFLGVGLGRGHHRRRSIGADALAVGSEQAMDRLPVGLAGDIPQCHIDSADRAHSSRTLPIPDLLIQALAVERILAQQHRLQVRDEGLPVAGRRIHGGAEKGVALDPLIGDQSQQPERAAARRIARSACHRWWAGMSSQANSVSVTSVIFIVASRFWLPANLIQSRPRGKAAVLRVP